MKLFIKIGLLSALILPALYPLSAQAAGLKGKEILGFRIGGVYTLSDMQEVFGNGTEMELHFIIGLGSWYGVDVALSSANFGDSKDVQKNIDFTGLNLGVELGIYSGTASFHAQKRISNKLSISGSGGGGLYVVTSIIAAGLYEGTKSENRFGLCCGAGLDYQLSKKLALELHGKYHYIFSGDGRWDAVYFYTGNTRTAFMQITIGVLIAVD
jgi:opacity protein-like surface antigen